MLTAVICCSAGADLEHELGGTVLWRRELERRFARDPEEAKALLARRPDLVLIDRDLAWAQTLVAWIRRNPTTRGLAVAVFARGDMDPAEIDLLSAGANAVLRLPAGPEWDKRLARLMHVSTRRDARFPVMFQLDAGPPGGARTLLAVAVDISETGMLIECDGLEVGGEMHVAFQLPGGSGLVSGRARVCRQAAADRFGVEFSELSGECLERIRAFLTPPGAV